MHLSSLIPDTDAGSMTHGLCTSDQGCGDSFPELQKARVQMALGQHDGQAWVKDDLCWCPAGLTQALLDTRFQAQQGETT